MEKLGIEKVFEITETFGPDTIKCVLNGDHYILAKKDSPLRPALYSYFKQSFSGEHHMYHSFRYTHVRLTKAIAEMKLDTEQTMKLE